MGRWDSDLPAFILHGSCRGRQQYHPKPRDRKTTFIRQSHLVTALERVLGADWSISPDLTESLQTSDSIDPLYA